MFKKVEAYIRHEKLTEVRSALVEVGVGRGRRPRRRYC